jgi:hypothetical protein
MHRLDPLPRVLEELRFGLSCSKVIASEGREPFANIAV